MDTHTFPESIKVQKFCLTLLGEYRLWYESLIHVGVDWNGLQAQFRQHYSRIGNTRDHKFHAWILFHFDKSSETTYSYVTCIRQVVTMLGYGEPKVLEVFKNTITSQLQLGSISYRTP